MAGISKTLTVSNRSGVTAAAAAGERVVDDTLVGRTTCVDGVGRPRGA